MNSFHSDVQQLVAQYLLDNLRSSLLSDRVSVITLPLKTIDDRWVSVIVEEKDAGYFLVHDGGKTDSELFCQGVTMELIESVNTRIADRYGVSIADDRSIQRLCTRAELPLTILAVAETAALMTVQLVSRVVEIEARDIEVRVSQTLDLISRDEFEIKHQMEIQGRWGRYIPNVVALAKHETRRNATINILSGKDTLRRARDYGIMCADLQGMPEYCDWASLALIVGATGWSPKVRKLVEDFSSRVIDVTPETQRDIEAATLQGFNEITSPDLPLRL